VRGKTRQLVHPVAIRRVTVYTDHLPQHLERHGHLRFQKVVQRSAMIHGSNFTIVIE
jgi:hypothetical protein